jgi:hypothetical protein
MLPIPGTAVNDDYQKRDVGDYGNEGNEGINVHLR